MEKYLKNDLELINQIGSLYEALSVKKREERSSNSVKQSNVALEVIEQMDLKDLIPEHVRSQTVRTCHKIFKGKMKMKKEEDERKAPGRKSIVQSAHISLLVAEVQQKIDSHELPSIKLREALTVTLLKELLKKIDPEYDSKVAQGRYNSYYLKFNLRNVILKRLGNQEQTCAFGENSESDTSSHCRNDIDVSDSTGNSSARDSVGYSSSDDSSSGDSSSDDSDESVEEEKSMKVVGAKRKVEAISSNDDISNAQEEPFLATSKKCLSVDKETTTNVTKSELSIISSVLPGFVMSIGAWVLKKM